jgi:hypothetical protein
MLKRSRILDHSYSRARLGHCEWCPPSFTERTYLLPPVYELGGSTVTPRA